MNSGKFSRNELEKKGPMEFKDLNTDSLKIFHGRIPLEKHIPVETTSINALSFYQEAPPLGDKSQDNENSGIE